MKDFFTVMGVIWFIIMICFGVVGFFAWRNSKRLAKKVKAEEKAYREAGNMTFVFEENNEIAQSSPIYIN